MGIKRSPSKADTIVTNNIRSGNPITSRYRKGEVSRFRRGKASTLDLFPPLRIHVTDDMGFCAGDDPDQLGVLIVDTNVNLGMNFWLSSSDAKKFARKLMEVASRMSNRIK